jgi:hypothetical protein
LPDPFGVGPDLTTFGVNVVAMISALMAAGMEKPDAMWFTLELMTRMAKGKTS